MMSFMIPDLAGFSVFENIHFHPGTGYISRYNQSLRRPGGHINREVGRPGFFKHT